MTPSEPELRRLRVYVTVLCCVGLVAALVALREYVIFTSGISTGPSFCNISAHINCEIVNASAWSQFFGIPVAGYGIFFYLCLLLVALYSGETRKISLRAFSQLSLLAGLTASIISLALLAISEFVIGALCIVCAMLYLVNFLLLGVTWWCGHRGNVRDGFVHALMNLKTFVGALCGGKNDDQTRVAHAWMAVAIMGTIAGVVYLLPTVVLQLVSATTTPHPVMVDKNNPIIDWEKAPRILIKNEIQSGAFGDYAKGTIGAPIEIVEFADFECPACRRLYTSMKPLLHKFEGKYQLFFRNYPLDSACNSTITRAFHRYACAAAHFSRCAGEQGKYWEAVDFLFTFPALEGEEPLEKVEGDIVHTGSNELSLDEQAIRECMKSGRHIAKLRQDIEEGNRIDLQGTPSLWINQKAVSHGSLPALESIFNHILQSHAQSEATAKP